MKAPLIALAAIALAALPLVAEDSVHDFKVKDIKGGDVDLSSYKGKVLLIVNVASKCGATPQYDPLQALHAKYAGKGLVVLGFPANNFGAQEPGTDAEIADFCTSNYSVEFPMFSKVSVKGDDKAPLFTYLTSAENPDKQGDIGWNFEKFLIGKDGKLIRRFATRVQPDDATVVAAI
ncbi:MAG: glutathione peroxidase, partial [Verrucomicrobia bacterium]|nr:glutathione peroxidase [Verrucomicrobiota bacterium]